MNAGSPAMGSYLIPLINDIYSIKEWKHQYRYKVAKIMLPLRDEYLECIRKLVNLELPFSLYYDKKENTIIQNDIDKIVILEKKEIANKLGLSYTKYLIYSQEKKWGIQL